MAEDPMVEARRQADIAEFQRRFPEAARDPKCIPAQVWDKVRTGSTLTDAYSEYAQFVERRAAQDTLNNARSTGSMRSAGGSGPCWDPFLAGWDGI